MDIDPMVYKKFIAIVVIVVVVWIVWVFYNVGREKFIKKFDYIKSKWKIVLFWFIVAAVIIGGWYLLVEWGLIDSYLEE